MIFVSPQTKDETKDECTLRHFFCSGRPWDTPGAKSLRGLPESQCFDDFWLFVCTFFLHLLLVEGGHTEHQTTDNKEQRTKKKHPTIEYPTVLRAIPASVPSMFYVLQPTDNKQQTTESKEHSNRGSGNGPQGIWTHFLEIVHGPPLRLSHAASHDDASLTRTWTELWTSPLWQVTQALGY